MKIRKRQNRLYELFNGRNKVRYVAISVAYVYLLVILVGYNCLEQYSSDLSNIISILLHIIFIRFFLRFIFKPLYRERFSPSVYYGFAQIKFNYSRNKFKIRKRQFKELKLNKAIIATKKYIDRHYNHVCDSDELLWRLKNVKSDYNIFSQLPSNYIIGVVTGFVSGFLTGNILKGENAILVIFNIVLYIILNLITILALCSAIKSFYSEYDSIIMPYEINKIKQKLSEIDSVYLNI